MFAELQFEDIIFGNFPKVGGEVRDVYGFWAKNSIGDIIEMLMQMLEVFFVLFMSCPSLKKALTFIHDLNIANRVIIISSSFSQKFKLIRSVPFRMRFHGNFVIQWHRVYLIDFEVAIQFPAECTEYDHVSMGLPLGSSFSTEPENYARLQASEFDSGIAYSPFKLDVWQLGISFSDSR
jgi:serine/threonine protein kinase